MPNPKEIKSTPPPPPGKFSIPPSKIQWMTPEEGKPEYGRPFVVVYRTKYKGSWLTIRAVETRYEWNTDAEADVFTAKGNEVIAWFYVPELTL